MRRIVANDDQTRFVRGDPNLPSPFDTLTLKSSGFWYKNKITLCRNVFARIEKSIL